MLSVCRIQHDQTKKSNHPSFFLSTRYLFHCADHDCPSFFFFTYVLLPQTNVSIETASSAFNQYSYYSNLLDQWTLHKQTNRFHSGPSLSVFCSYFYRMCRWVILYANELSTRRQYKKFKHPFIRLLRGKYNSVPIFYRSFFSDKIAHPVWPKIKWPAGRIIKEKGDAWAENNAI